MHTKLGNTLVASLIVFASSLAFALNNSDLVVSIDEGASSLSVASYTPSKYSASAGNASQVRIHTYRFNSRLAVSIAAYERERQLMRALAALGIAAG